MILHSMIGAKCGIQKHYMWNHFITELFELYMFAKCPTVGTDNLTNANIIMYKVV